jgi:PAS domain S-box-containing protein
MGPGREHGPPPADGAQTATGIASQPSVTPEVSEHRLETRTRQLEALFHLSKAVAKAERVEEVYNAALEGMIATLGAERAAVLVMDARAVMHFEAWTGLSEDYRKAVDGHSPWPRDSVDPQPVLIEDARTDPGVAPWRNAILSEGIGALAFLPLVGRQGLLGKLMVYYNRPHRFEADEVRLARAFAEHVAFALERKLTEDALRSTKARLLTLMKQVAVGIAQIDSTGRFMLTNNRYCEIVGRSRAELLELTVQDITHPEDRPAYQKQMERLVEEGVDFTVEKRELRPDGSEVWVNNSVLAVYDDEARIHHLTVISQDITDRKLAEERLHDAHRRKDTFLAMLGHELRNPLNPILSANEAMRLAGHREPGLDHMREIIDRQVGYMARLLDDLLDVSRISSGRIALKRSRIDLSALVRTTLEDARLGFEKVGLRLDAEVPDEPLWVNGDPTRLAQILTNLLNNALKFTPVDGRVAVRLRRDPERAQAILTVSDTGIGLAPEMLDKVFEVFVQADRAPDQARAGLGLGLALVKGLVQLHGGTVRAQSLGPDRGAEFEVALPLDATTPSGIRAVGAPARVPSRRVLIIEDNLDSADSLCTALRLRGHQATVAYTGPEGLAKARQFEPEIVLCDIGLPGHMDGYGVARALRRDLMLGSVLLIALTGYGQEEDRRHALEVGFDLHLRKPVSPADLEKLFAARLSR